jgi:hypothetical protein
MKFTLLTIITLLTFGVAAHADDDWVRIANAAIEHDDAQLAERALIGRSF